MNHKQLKLDQVGILAFYYSIFKVNVKKEFRVKWEPETIKKQFLI